MNLFSTTAIAAGLVAGLAVPGVAATLNGSIGYGLGSNGTSLVIFDNLGAGDLSRSSGNQRTITLDQVVDALAYRPVTGQLLAYQKGGSAGDSVFTVNTTTGMLTNTGAIAAPGSGFATNTNNRVGFDFNNSLDAARAVNVDNDNNVFFPDDFGDARANTIGKFTDLFYTSMDPNAGTDPSVFANAYTNAVDGMTSPTTLQYVLDAATDSLATLANNAGELTTVGAITVNGQALDFDTVGGFDILSDSVGDNLAVALLRSGGMSGLYTVDLDTGAATMFSDLGNQRLTSFAAQTEVSAVPVPAAGVLLAAAIGGLGFGARRRARG